MVFLPNSQNFQLTNKPACCDALLPFDKDLGLALHEAYEHDHADEAIPEASTSAWELNCSDCEQDLQEDSKERRPLCSAQLCVCVVQHVWSMMI